MFQGETGAQKTENIAQNLEVGRYRGQREKHREDFCKTGWRDGGVWELRSYIYCSAEDDFDDTDCHIGYRLKYYERREYSWKAVIDIDNLRPTISLQTYNLLQRESCVMGEKSYLEFACGYVEYILSLFEF